MYILPPISNWGVRHGTPLEVVCNNHSPAPIYGGYQPRTGVFVAHVVLSVLAALGICVGYMCVLWCLELTWCCLCVGYIMYSGVLGVHLVQEGSGPCKIPNLSHLLWSYGTYIYSAGHVRIDVSMLI